LVWCRVSELLRLFNVEYKILKSFDVSLYWFLKNLFVVNIVVVAASFIGFQRRRKKISSNYFLWEKNSIRKKKKIKWKKIKLKIY
jgi:Na+/H+ antiporter NhaD/arsenite permease-like protein